MYKLTEVLLELEKAGLEEPYKTEYQKIGFYKPNQGKSRLDYIEINYSNNEVVRYGGINGLDWNLYSHDTLAEAIEKLKELLK